jgi:ATP-dependent Clp protease ATP-binding subunit ClpC
MVAGTKYRGQFEERIKALMAEVENDKSIILYR